MCDDSRYYVVVNLVNFTASVFQCEREVCVCEREDDADRIAELLNAERDNA